MAFFVVALLQEKYVSVGFCVSQERLDFHLRVLTAAAIIRSNPKEFFI